MRDIYIENVRVLACLKMEYSPKYRMGPKM